MAKTILNTRKRYAAKNHVERQRAQKQISTYAEAIQRGVTEERRRRIFAGMDGEFDGWIDRTIATVERIMAAHG